MIVALFHHEAGLAHALEQLRTARIGPLGTYTIETYTPAPLQDQDTTSPHSTCDPAGRASGCRRELRVADLLLHRRLPVQYWRATEFLLGTVHSPMRSRTLSWSLLPLGFSRSS